MSNSNNVVMCFGVFDLLHDGHRHFLTEAKKLGDYLIVVVARDSTVVLIKDLNPHEPLLKRMRNLKKGGLADKVAAGDKKQGSWQCVHKYKPDIIALGYDQKQLKFHLRTYIKKNGLPITLSTVTPYLDGEVHSNVIRRNLKL